MTTLKLLKTKKAYLGAFLLLSSLSINAQEPLATDNVLIEGVTVDAFFHQEPDTNADKTTFAVNASDGDPTTDWAGNITFVDAGTEPFLTFNLGGPQDLTEIQYLTVNRQYLFQVWISTTVTDDYTQAQFVNITPDRIDNVTKNGESFLTSNDDITYKSFDLGENPGVTFVNIYCGGRTDSDWNTISELSFYRADATASVEENELSSALIYPNPANDFVSLTNVNEEVSKIDVLNLQGQIVLSQNVNDAGQEVLLNTSSLANGVYFVNLTNASGNLSASKTVIVQH